MLAGNHSHECAKGAAIGLGTEALDLQPIVFRVAIIAKQRGRLIHINHGHINVSVVVKVAEGRPAAAVRLSYTRSGARCNIFKASVAQVLVYILCLLESDM